MCVLCGTDARLRYGKKPTTSQHDFHSPNIFIFLFSFPRFFRSVFFRIFLWIVFRGLVYHMLSCGVVVFNHPSLRPSCWIVAKNVIALWTMYSLFVVCHLCESTTSHDCVGIVLFSPLAHRVSGLVGGLSGVKLFRGVAAATDSYMTNGSFSNLLVSKMWFEIWTRIAFF